MFHLRCAIVLLTALSYCWHQAAMAEETRFTVTLDPVNHGSITLEPPLGDEGTYAAGTVVTVTAQPDTDYVVDSIYYSVPGPWGAMYHEALLPKFQITIDQDKHIGASFIEADKVASTTVKHDVVYAKPGVKPLKYDVYSPLNAKDLPIVVIIHGGGWSTNDENIMRGLARELTDSGKLVVCSIDYRWIGDNDGDEAPNSMAQLIEDVFGAIVHIQEHAREYGGDPSRLGVTGDSAGGHLSAAAAVLIDRVGSRGFGKVENVYEFLPTYLPQNKSAEQVRDELKTSIRAAAPSYGVFAAEPLGRFVRGLSDEAVQAVSPQSNIPHRDDRTIPHYLLRGTRDFLIRHDDVEAYRQSLLEQGQVCIYEQVDEAGHAFFDWKPNDQVKATFQRFGVPYAAKMREFFEQHLYGHETL